MFAPLIQRPIPFLKIARSTCSYQIFKCGLSTLRDRDNMIDLEHPILMGCATVAACVVITFKYGPSQVRGNWLPCISTIRSCHSKSPLVCLPSCRSEGGTLVHTREAICSQD